MDELLSLPKVAPPWGNPFAGRTHELPRPEAAEPRLAADEVRLLILQQQWDAAEAARQEHERWRASGGAAVRAD
jgi:hypothetical protein